MSTSLEGSLSSFDSAVRAVAEKGKLSPKIVENVVSLAMSQINADAHLVSTLFRANKKATSQNKISALYLLDAVCREARTRLKKQGKQKEKKPAQEQDPVEGVDSQGTYSSFLTKVEQILPKFMLDCWENGPVEHRDKVRKVLDIWTKAGTFGAPALLRVSNKLVATSTPSAAAPQSPAVPITPSAIPLDTPVASGSTIPANVLALLARQAAAGAVPTVASGLGYGSPNPPPTIPALPPLDFALLQQLANATANATSQNSPLQQQQRPGGAPPQQRQQQNHMDNRDGDQRRGSEQEWNRDGNNGGNYRGNGQGNGQGNGGGGNWDANNDRSGSSSSGGNWGGQQQQNNNSFSNQNNSWNGPPQNRPPPPQQQQGGSMNNGPRGSWDQNQSSRPGGDPNRAGNNFGNRDGPGRPGGDFSQQGVQFNAGTTRRDPPESVNEPPAKRAFPPQNFSGNSYLPNNSHSTPLPPHSPSTSNDSPAAAGKAQIHPSRLSLQAVRPDLDEFGREKRPDAEPDSPPRVYTRPGPISPALGSASNNSSFPPPSPAQPILAPSTTASPVPTDDRQLVAQQLQQRIKMQNQAKAAIQAQAQAQMQTQRVQPTSQAPPHQYQQQQQQQQQPPAPMPNRQPMQQQPPPVVVPPPVVPFDMTSFDATNPSSWTGFATMYKAQYGFAPTNEQIMGMVMSSMQQSMYAQQGDGAGAGGYGGAGMGNDQGGAMGGNQS